MTDFGKAMDRVRDTLNADTDELAEVVWAMSTVVDGEERGALLSADGAYRFMLDRTWDRSRQRAVWIMLNPSTADHETDDPTIRRVRGFSMDWGFGGAVVINLYPLRSTDPTELLTHPHPEGPPGTDHRIRSRITMERREDPRVFCAWGAHPAVTKARVTAVLQQVFLAGAEPHRLGPPTKAGHPRHPLYLPKSTRPEAMTDG